MKIQNKLFLAFGILIVLMIFTGIFSLVRYIGTDSEYSNLITRTALRQSYLSRAIEDVTNFRLSCLSSMNDIAEEGVQLEVMSHLPDDQKEMIGSFGQSIIYFHESVLYDPDLNEQERKYFSDAWEHIYDGFAVSYTKYMNDVNNAIKNRDEELFRRAMLQGMIDANDIGRRLEKLSEEDLIRIEERNQEITDNSFKTTTLVAIINLCIVIFSVLISIYMARSIKKPIASIQKAMAEVSHGNISYSIHSEYCDEMGMLSNDIGRMVNKISELNKAVAFIDYLDCMIHIASFDYKIVYLNNKMAETYGVDRYGSVGQKCYKVFHGYEQPCPHCLWPRVLSSKEQNKPFERERYWDEKLCKWIGGKAAVIRWMDGSLVQFYYLTDETLKRDYETKLQEAAEAAEAASLSKSAFLANMSHEIRTPMNAILGITEMQMENESLPRETQEALGKIYNSGDLLLGIINDILDFSKIEAGKLELLISRYEVASLINDTVQLNMMRFESKPIEFKLQVDETIPGALCGDELRIKQILNNLLSNAAKYTKSGEVIFSIGVESTEQNDTVMLVLKVKDTGQGMTAEQVSTLFDEYTRFNQGENRTVEGTGLGMSITLRLLQMMNGTIAVDSKPGEGSEFTVRLPQAVTGADMLGKEVANNLMQFRVNATSQMKKAHILREPMPYGSVLVVDDLDANLYVATGLLTPYGLKIDTADSGVNAIEKIKAGNEYDVIFMDHMMPEMDGIEAVKIIRGMGYTRPIVALTANAVVGQSDVFLQNGFDDFISKPIDTRQLNALLNKLIRDKQPPEVLAAAYDRAQQQVVNQKDSAQSNDQGSNDEGSDDPLMTELSQIEGLDVGTGIAYMGQNKDGYLHILRHFAEHCDAYIDELDKTLKAENWNAYAIKVHALKGVLATLGMGKLSGWAAKLEKDSKAGEESAYQQCRDETAPFSAELAEFKNRLNQAFAVQDTLAAANGESAKPAGDEKFLKEQLALLKEACEKCSFGDTKKILADIDQYGWGSETKAELEKISGFAVSFDYDEALKEIDRLM